MHSLKQLSIGAGKGTGRFEDEQFFEPRNKALEIKWPEDGAKKGKQSSHADVKIRRNELLFSKIICDIYKSTSNVLKLDYDSDIAEGFHFAKHMSNLDNNYGKNKSPVVKGYV